MDSLGSAGGMLGQYTEALQAEVSQREHLIELLRALLGPQVGHRCSSTLGPDCVHPFNWVARTTL